MKWHNLLVCLSLVFLPLSASDEIYVKLQTEEKLFPLYLSKLRIVDSKQTSKDFKALEKVFSFDLSNNGKTELLDHLDHLEKQLDKDRNSITKDLSFWKKEGIHFVIDWEVRNDKLNVEVTDIRKNHSKWLTNLQLKGDLSEDRRLIHKMADAIHKELFGKEGVCSTKILFTIRQKNNDSKLNLEWTSEAYECDYDGDNIRQVTFDNNYCVSPKYFPPQDGNKSASFFYVSYKEGIPKIYISDLNGKNVQRFSYLRGNQLMPEISLDRNFIVFINDVPGNPEVFLQRFSSEVGAIGKPRQIFACPRSVQASPTISPDLSKIAFVSDKTGTPRIYLMDIPQPKTTQEDISLILISKKNRESTSPNWSKDGTKIAYSSRVNGVRQIWIYDFAKKEERQLTFGPGNKENPCFAPDSLHIAFNSAGSYKSELYIVNINQPKAIKITKGSGEKRFPSWEPRAL